MTANEALWTGLALGTGIIVGSLAQSNLILILGLIIFVGFAAMKIKRI